MSTELKKKEPAKTTTGRYSTVEELMVASGVSAETQQIVAELRKECQLTSQLALMRTAAGITQEQMADKVGCTQSCISKLESGNDEDITLKQLRAYAEVTGQRIGVGVGKPVSHVEAIKLHALGMRDHLQSLAKLAHGDHELEAGIEKFFSEAFFNILDILALSQRELPNGGNIEFRLDIAEKPRGGTRPTPSPSKLPSTFGAVGRRKIAI